jgi:hypothetical protein
MLHNFAQKLELNELRIPRRLSLAGDIMLVENFH